MPKKLKPFASAEYRKRTAISSTRKECCLCGRQTTEDDGGVLHVPVNHETNEFVTDEEIAELGEDAVSWFPIGPECVKKLQKGTKGMSARLPLGRITF
jgi:hypothetical protein